MLKPDPGTYALILRSQSTKAIQVGRWGQLDLQPGYYLYVGSSFGSGGVRARVSRHLRREKRKHWHIDYLREHVTPEEVWISYAANRLEHKWAGILFELPEMLPVQDFGCSDCGCYSHLFFTLRMPESNHLGRVERMPV
jgi:Uri superfamily endonuclease